MQLNDKEQNDRSLLFENEAWSLFIGMKYFIRSNVLRFICFYSSLRFAPQFGDHIQSSNAFFVCKNEDETYEKNTDNQN